MTLEKIERNRGTKDYLSATVTPGLIKAMDEVISTFPYRISRSQYVEKVWVKL